jgi:hypothetical protein
VRGRPSPATSPGGVGRGRQRLGSCEADSVCAYVQSSCRSAAGACAVDGRRARPCGGGSWVVTCGVGRTGCALRLRQQWEAATGAMGALSEQGSSMAVALSMRRQQSGQRAARTTRVAAVLRPLCSTRARVSVASMALEGVYRWSSRRPCHRGTVVVAAQRFCLRRRPPTRVRRPWTPVGHGAQFLRETSSLWRAKRLTCSPTMTEYDS